MPFCGGGGLSNTAGGLGNGGCTTATSTNGQGQWYFQTGTAGGATTTSCYTTITGGAGGTTTAYYANGQWYTDQYQNQYQNQANQAHFQPVQKSQKELQANDQKAYQKALNEHNGQEAARLRRIIVDREKVMAANKAAEEKRKREYELEQERRKAADKRAMDLLIEHLTPEQRKSYNERKWFVVEGGKSKTKYRINANGSLMANIDVLAEKSDQRLHRLCAHLQHGSVPLGDQLLAQKIVLETDEDAFLRIANRHAA